ncbi:MAG: starch-binding protein [Myxococcota bacterium]|nr:starch-binding protein [Myxococcota bacterium]
MRLTRLLLSIWVLGLVFIGCGEDEPAVQVNAPVFSPSPGSYSQAQIVSLSSATEGAVVYYSFDAQSAQDTWTAFSTPLTLGPGEHLIAAYAQLGSARSSVVQGEYRIDDSVSSDRLELHFKKPEHWASTVYVHYWNTVPEIPESVWPGALMNDEGSGWYSYTIEGVLSAQLLFNDGNGQQTEDLSREGRGYYADGQWSDTHPDGLMVHFHRPAGWADTVYIHYWDTSPAVGETQWPGELMQSEGDDWYSYLIKGAVSASIVFNDGSGQQTGDLSRALEGWYYEQQWFDAKPGALPVLTATPPAGTYLGPQSVSLSSSVAGTSIYYTTDGSSPSEASTLYVGPIAVSSSTTIKAMGVAGGRLGEVATFVYTIGDNPIDEPPLAVLSVTPSRIEANVSTVLQLDASASSDPEGGAMQIRWDLRGNEQWTEWTSFEQDKQRSETVSASVGFNIRVEVRDAAQQVSRAEKSVSIGGLQPLGDFREETIYFLMTARWNDGDPSNNYYNRDRLEDGDPQWRGDFKGLIERLDYIEDLGFTAIWITPPVENRSGLDYHGYHAYDWNVIDPRLESPGATYQDLIDAAHARGIKIIQDVVINHSSQYGIRGKVWIDHLPIKYFVKQGMQQGQVDHGPYQGNLGDYRSPWREDNDNPVAPAWFRERQSSDPEGVLPLVDPLTGQTVPQPGYNANRFFGIDAMTLDPDWYHLDGFMAGGDWENPWALQQKHMAGDCIDLATEKQHVQDYINEAIYQYLDMGVDAIRLDTVKHVERGNLLQFVNAWKAHRPGLFVFGENLVKGLGWGDLGGDNGPSQIRPWWYTRLGNDPHDPNSGGDSGFAVLDFGLFSTFRDNVSRGGYGGIGGVLGMDWVYGDATTLVTFLQNHDVGPDNDFKFRFKGDQWMAAAAYNLLWTIRGIPCLYYGEEIEFMKGAPQDIAEANDTLSMTGRAYFGDHLSSANLPTTQSHPLYQHIKRLNQIRRAVPALQKGAMDKVNEWGGGMSFVRDYNNGESYVVVGLAIGGGANVNVGGVRNGTYRDAVTGRELNVSGGNISFDVQANSAGIYVLDGPGKIGQDGTYLR